MRQLQPITEEVLADIFAGFKPRPNTMGLEKQHKRKSLQVPLVSLELFHYGEVLKASVLWTS